MGEIKKAICDKYQFTFGKGASFKVRYARLFSGVFDHAGASVLGEAVTDCYAFFSAFSILDEEG